MEKQVIEKLIDTAIEQLKFSYAPYSNFKVGAALLAAVKVELYQDIKSAARSMLHIRDSYEPSKDISDRYELKYRQYLELVSNGIKTGGGSA